jgi:hypothetical protein
MNRRFSGRRGEHFRTGDDAAVDDDTVRRLHAKIGELAMSK